MLTGRALFLLLGITLLYSQPSSAAVSGSDAGQQQAGQTVKAKTQEAPKTPEYLEEVYVLPAFCVAKWDASMTTVTPPAGGDCPAGQVQIQAENAADIAKAMSADADYDVVAMGTDRLVIYRKVKDEKTLTGTRSRQYLEGQIARLARPPFNYLALVRVPRGTAKDIAPQVKRWNGVGISADAVGNDHILLKSDNVPDAQTLADLKVRIQSLGWRRPSAPPTQRLFYLDAATTVKSLSGGGDDKSDSSKTADKAGSAAKGASATSSPSMAVTITATGSEQDGKAAADKSGDAKADDAGSAGTDAAKGKPAATVKVADSAKSSGADAKALDMKAVKDTLVYSNADGGDENIWERNRLMAVLDLPRPEVLLNLLSFQASSDKYDVVNKESEAVREAVTYHNEVLQQAIQKGWEHLSGKIKSEGPGFWDQQFYNYITRKYVLEVTPLFHRNQREIWGWCDADEYCLGFRAFDPLRPTFTNILLALTAAKDPVTVADGTIDAMTGKCNSDIPTPEPCPAPKGEEDKGEDEKTASFLACAQSGAHEIEQRLIQEMGISNRYSGDCELVDELTLMRQVENQQSETLQLNCFRQQAKHSFEGEQRTDPVTKAQSKYGVTHVGLLRAAVADFLFNYKWATEFPHEFVPYDLNQSAQELNAELNPLILAFNRDVVAFTQHMQSEIECEEQQYERTKTFTNDAMITVRGISGVESIVDTVTQNYFDATKPPSLTDLVQSVASAEKNVPGVLAGNLTANEAAVLLGALNSVQPAQAKIGRELDVDITPHSLPGASAAELEVKLTNQETANPTLYKGGKTSDDDLSRVGKHNTTTKVRVESLKLFEVSSLSAKLQRPRSGFPLLPPFFEVPYFGSFLSWPLKGATEYHRSTAVVSAVIVPTAADLAYGIDFGADRVCGEADPDYGTQCHAAKSLDDFHGLPLRNYHKAMVQCFATGGRSAALGLETLSEETKKSAPMALGIKGTVEDICKNLTFSNVPPAD